VSRSRGLAAVLSFSAAILGGSSPANAQKFIYGGARGCAHVYLYASNKHNDEVITVNIARERLGLSVGTTSLTLEEAGDHISVQVLLFPTPQRYIDLCTDARLPFDGSAPAEGYLSSSGMPSFGSVLEAGEVELIRAYVVRQAEMLYAEEQNGSAGNRELEAVTFGQASAADAWNRGE
jgi:hypothetical protein